MVVVELSVTSNLSVVRGTGAMNPRIPTNPSGARRAIPLVGARCDGGALQVAEALLRCRFNIYEPASLRRASRHRDFHSLPSSELSRPACVCVCVPGATNTSALLIRASIAIGCAHRADLIEIENPCGSDEPFEK